MLSAVCGSRPELARLSHRSPLSFQKLPLHSPGHTHGCWENHPCGPKPLPGAQSMSKLLRPEISSPSLANKCQRPEKTRANPPAHVCAPSGRGLRLGSDALGVGNA